MADVTVTVRDNGPLLIQGPIKVVDAEGNEFTFDKAKPAIALCRCGQSGSNPFCDGSHKSCGFESLPRAQ